MDDVVKAAMRRWPNVPDCLGWLGLDARGDWYLRDDACQQAGIFVPPDAMTPPPPLAKGSRLVHEGLCAFIGRNYTYTDTGLWFFQNGPQRVYVELAHTPWIWRWVDDQPLTLCAHTQHHRTHAQTWWQDEQGRLYADTSLGLGLVHSLDVLPCVDALEAQSIEPAFCAWEELPKRFGFVRSPQAVRVK